MSPSIRHRALVLRKFESKFAPLPTALLAAALLASPLAAQTSPATTRTHHRAHQAAAKKPTPATPAPVTPPAPPAPDWPMNDRPAHAAVTWDSQLLRINATNSSLQQILADVSSATGARFEGVNQDQRIFGDYGPGRARDVLTQLLQGSGYNFLMVGDEGQGVPRQIVLSSPRSGNEPPSAARPGQDEPEEEIVDTPPVEQQPQPNPPAPPIRPGFSPDGSPRTPQQIQQEMLLRQQQQMQQQQGQPNNPQNQ